MTQEEILAASLPYYRRRLTQKIILAMITNTPTMPIDLVYVDAAAWAVDLANKICDGLIKHEQADPPAPVI